MVRNTYPSKGVEQSIQKRKRRRGPPNGPTWFICHLLINALMLVAIGAIAVVLDRLSDWAHSLGIHPLLLIYFKGSELVLVAFDLVLFFKIVRDAVNRFRKPPRR